MCDAVCLISLVATPYLPKKKKHEAKTITHFIIIII